MTITAFVPIKLKSQWLANKNILDLNGKPLAYYIFEKLLKSNVDRIVVYCSDEKIMDYVPKDVEFIKRDQYLDNDHIQGHDIYNSFINKINSEFYLLCHATSPFVSSKSINLGIKKVIDNTPYDSSFTVKREQSFAWYKKTPLNYSLDNIPRTQEIEPVFVETSAFFMFSKKIYKELKTRIGKNPYMVELNKFESIDIDTKEDFELAKIYSKNYE